MYPNPAQSEVQLVFNQSNLQPVLVYLYNVQGELLFTTQMASMQQELTIQLNHLSNGVYQIQLVAPDYLIGKRLVIAK